MSERIDATKGSDDILAQLQKDFDAEQQKTAAAAAATDGATAATAANEDEELEYSVELEGGQKLSFVGKTPEEIQGKVEAALKNALKAKTEPAAAATTTEARPVSKRKQLSKDEEFAVVQEIRSGNLVEGLRKLIEAQYGLTPERADEINQEIDDQKKYRVATQATSQFLENHQDFVPSEHNKKMIGNYLLKMGKDPTLANLEEAYKDLSAANLLITKKPEEGPQTTSATTTTTTATRKPAPSGLFGRRGAAATSARSDKKTPTDAEMEKIVKEGGSQALLEHLEAVNS